MENVKYSVKDGKLTIEVNLKAATRPSATGKTAIVASTSGSAKIEGTDFIMNLSIYTKGGK